MKVLGNTIRALFASILCAATTWAGTTISDTIRIFDGTAFSGSISITGPAMTTASGTAIVRGTSTYTVTAGVFSATLEPNDTAQPANTSYVVRYFPAQGQGWQEIWFVPTSTGLYRTLHIADVKLTTAATAGLFVQPMQIGSGGAQDQQLLLWNGSSMHWGPSNLPPSQIRSGGAQDGQVLRWSASLAQWTPVSPNQESPFGYVDGTNATFTLSVAPSTGASLILFRNGMALRIGFDYTLTGRTLTFSAGSIPQLGDMLLAWYPY